MQVEIFTFCDAATRHAGKVNLIGTFDTLHFSEFPAESGPFALVSVVRFSPDDGGEHELAIEWRDADGGVIGEPEVRYTRLDPLRRRDLAQDIWSCYGKTFFAPGEFLVQLTVDGQAAASVPLFVKSRVS